MNISFLKNIRDRIPEPLKYTAGKIFRNTLIRNSQFCKYYKLLENREVLDSGKVKDYQFSQLKQILIYSYQNVPYYHELFNKISFDPNKLSYFEQIEKIPFLTREIVSEKFHKLFSKRIVKGGYYVGKTGGSTGLPIKIIHDYDSIFKENAFIYYFRKKLGYRFDDKLATFRDVDIYKKYSKYNPMHNEMIFSPIKLSKITIKKYANEINEFKPHYLNGYLSTIWYFAKLFDEYQLKLNTNLKGIFLISESIDNTQRKYIEQFFNIKSATFYGHSERCVIAEEISPDRYRFDPYYGYSEQFSLGNNQYSIVGTGFLNYKMPFIRYKTDDVCSPADQFWNIFGKRNSTTGLIGYNDEFLSSSAFDLDEPIFKNITTYQFIQNKKGQADLLIIVNKNFFISEIEMIKKEIYSKTKGIIDINVKIVDQLLLTPAGKYQRYVSNLKED